jgi:hypothetical protein
MTTSTKPRVRIRADSATINTVRQIMTKAGDEIADAVDVVIDGQPYGTDWPVVTDRVPNARENPVGRPLDMSGNGPQQASEAGYSQPASQSEITRAYAALADLLMQNNKRVEGLEKSLRTLGKAFATFAGLSKSADELDESDEDEGDDTAKANQPKGPGNSGGREDSPTGLEVSGADLSATEKSALQGNIASKSMQQIFSEMAQAASGFSHDTRRPGLTPPPDYSRPFVAKARVNGPSDDEIAAMDDPGDRVQALLERQRSYHRARLGIA